MVAERDNSRFSILNSRFSILGFSLTEFSILDSEFSIFDSHVRGGVRNQWTGLDWTRLNLTDLLYKLHS